MRRGAVLLVMALGGCSALYGPQSSAMGQGMESAHIGNLFDLFLWVTVPIYLGVMVFLALAMRRRQARVQGAARPEQEAGWRLGLVLFAVTSALILFGLSVATWFTDRAIARAGAGPALSVEVIGHQWWWEVRYHDPVAGRELRTANELVIPAGATVKVSLSSPDVIHSLWIPNLAGKQDLIPGRASDVVLKVPKPGEFRAQCAEFCGLQHAQMALPVSVRAPGGFAKWYNAGLATPPVPGGGPEFAGYSLFTGRQCASCHNIAGTPASGQVAPDLTHFGSRTTIASGALPNTAASLDRWIADPQRVKPGTQMPQVPLSPEERAAVVAYLESLK